MEWMEWLLVKAQSGEWREIWVAPWGTGGKGDGQMLSTDSIGSDALSQVVSGPYRALNPNQQGAQGSRRGPGLDLPDLSC